MPPSQTVKRRQVKSNINLRNIRKIAQLQKFEIIDGGKNGWEYRNREDITLLPANTMVVGSKRGEYSSDYDLYPKITPTHGDPDQGD